MILTRTPLRVSFFGGGSDLPSYFQDNPGAVLSTTINKYMYIALCKTAYPGVKLVYNDIETVSNFEDLKHSRVRECLRTFNVTSNVEISSFCEIPTKGTGLGSSSTFTVGLVTALSSSTGAYSDLAQYKIADTACRIEMGNCNEPIGKQDQYAAAFGGLNIIKFYHDLVEVQSCNMVNNSTIDKFNDNLLLFYTGMARSASEILSAQAENKNKNAILKDMVRHVDLAYALLYQEDIDSVGALLHEAWRLKKQLSSNTTNDRIDTYYEKALKYGALGGKILGAGGGGYLLLYVPKEKQLDVLHALDDLMSINFKFDNTGTQVIYDEAKFIF